MSIRWSWVPSPYTQLWHLENHLSLKDGPELFFLLSHCLEAPKIRVNRLNMQNLKQRWLSWNIVHIHLECCFSESSLETIHWFYLYKSREKQSEVGVWHILLCMKSGLHLILDDIQSIISSQNAWTRAKAWRYFTAENDDSSPALLSTEIYLRKWSRNNAFPFFRRAYDQGPVPLGCGLTSIIPYLQNKLDQESCNGHQ